MFTIVEKSKPQIENVELQIGDIVITNRYRYLIVCDGYGHYSFINLDTGYIVSDSETGSPYYVSCNNKYSEGDRLFGIEYNTNIVDIISNKDVTITVEY